MGYPRYTMMKFDEAWPYAALSVKFLKKFKQYLINLPYCPKPSHIWSLIKDVKTYLKLDSKEPMIFIHEDVVGFPNPEPSIKTNFLNNDERRRLLILYKNREYYEREFVRILKAFLFSCFTGLRISDIYRVNRDWRLSDNFLDFIPHKNRKAGQIIHVPVMPMAYEFVNPGIRLYFELPMEKTYNKQLKK